MLHPVRFLGLCFASEALLLSNAPAAGHEEAPVSPGDAAAVHVLIETVSVDGRGTRTLGSDEADLLPGAAGVLEKLIRLIGRDDPRHQESVRIKARITPLPRATAAQACSLRLEVEATRTPTGAAAHAKPRKPDTISATVELAPGEERLVEAYASPVTEGRVAFRIKCAPARATLTTDNSVQMVALIVTIDRTADGEQTEVLHNQVLSAALARQASLVASANVRLPDGIEAARRFRRESLEVLLSPQLIVAGRLQIEVQVSGAVATVGASSEVIQHPIQLSNTFVLEPGEPRLMEFEIASRGPDEGWSRVRFRLHLSTRF